MSDDICRVRQMFLEDLPMVLSWRNAPVIRKFMLNQHEIAESEHRQWFQKASADPGRHLLVVERGDDGPVGFVQFSDISSGYAADWGFYAAPDVPKGRGRLLGRAALEFAFEILKLNKVCGQALDFNEASIGFHLSLGFKEEGRLRQQHRIGDEYCDLICFGLLRQEWQQRLKDRML